MNARTKALTFAALLSAACGFLLTSCDPDVGPDALKQAPPPGLTIIAKKYDLDPWLKPIKDTLKRYRWITVISDTAYYHGRTNVTRFVARNDSSRRFIPGDTTYISYSENGDVEFYEKFTDQMRILGHGRWLPIPVGLKGEKTAVAYDTSFQLDRVLYTYRENRTWRFNGPGLTLEDGPFPSFGGTPTNALTTEILQEVSRSENLNRIPIRTVMRFWYSPTLGMLVRYEILTTIRRSGSQTIVDTTSGQGYSATSIFMR